MFENRRSDAGVHLTPGVSQAPGSGFVFVMWAEQTQLGVLCLMVSMRPLPNLPNNTNWSVSEVLAYPQQLTSLPLTRLVSPPNQYIFMVKEVLVRQIFHMHLFGSLSKSFL